MIQAIGILTKRSFFSMLVYSPLQDAPSLSSVYPVLQLQENDPAVLEHV